MQPQPTLRGQRPQFGHHLARQGRQAAGPAPEGIGAKLQRGQVQQGVDQRQHAVATGVHFAEQVLEADLALIQRKLRAHLGEPDDRLQRRRAVRG